MFASARQWSCALLLLAPSALIAQGVPALADSVLRRPDSLSTVQHLTSDGLGGAAADSVEGPLLFLPGVDGSLRGISVRGAEPGQTGVLVNGIDITPGTRTAWVALPTNGVRNAWAVTGPLSARYAAARALQFEVPTGLDSAGARFAYSTDRWLGASSLGINRFEAHAGTTGRNYRLFLAGTLMGQKSADFGTDARSVPIFAPLGVDTTVRFAAIPGNSFSDTLVVDVPAWGVTRGDCDAFQASANTGIASNYGTDCTGDRTPRSAQSRYRFAVSGQFDLNRTARLGFLALKSRTDARLFDYSNINNPANLRGDQQLASVYAVTLSGQLGRGPTPGAYRLGVSRQANQRMDGPLTAEGERKTRNPALGLMLGGLDFRWDFESFPVDTALVNNYRLNRQGSRRSPYDLANVDQYNLQNNYRDGPYGLYGFGGLTPFYEAGGPVGGLALFHERRTTGFADLAWQVNRNSVVSVGGTFARYDVTNYEHQLTSQIFSDVYIEHPRSGAVYAEQKFSYDRVELSAGLRYDFFSSNADRPATLDTVGFICCSGQANPDYGTYQQYPAISSYGAEGQTATINGEVLPLRGTIEDQRHAAWSPRVRASLRIGEGTVLRGGISREVRMPDLAQLYAGINTDLTLTSAGQIFGTDLGFERSWHEELGVRQRLGDDLSLDLVGFHRTIDSVALSRLVNLRNPTRNDSPTSIRQYVDIGHYATQGASFSLDYSTATLGAMLSYQYLDTDETFENASWNAWSRPHMLLAVVQIRAPAALRSGWLARSQLWAGFQLASGTSYLGCGYPLTLALTYSDQACPPPTGIGGISAAYTRLPMRKVLDLRFAKALGSAAYAPRFFIDARNALNFHNVIRALRDSGSVGVARERAVQNGLGEVRTEALMNGAYDDTNGSVNLSTPDACQSWVTINGNHGGAPNCVALRRAEARYGDGDGVYTVGEQRAAVNAAFDATYGVGLNGTPRRIRIGIELGI